MSNCSSDSHTKTKTQKQATEDQRTLKSDFWLWELENTTYCASEPHSLNSEAAIDIYVKLTKIICCDVPHVFISLVQSNTCGIILKTYPENETVYF